MNNQSVAQPTDRKSLSSANERLLEYGDRTGPGSPARVVMGDASLFYAAVPTLIYVVLSEGGSKGVDDHDRVAGLDNRGKVSFEHVMGRLIDTLDLVAGLALATGEQQTEIAEAIRGLHRHIGGTLEDGRRYHAWNKDLWAWTWGGIIKPPLDAYEQLHGPVTKEFAEDYYIGALQIGDLIGVRGLPDTYTEFLDYWEQQWIPLASGTGTGKYIYSLLHDLPRPAVAPWIPTPLWNAMTWPLRHALATGALIVIEPRIQQMLELEPTRAQQLSVRIQKRLWRAAPEVFTRGWFERAIAARLRFGNTSWHRHYSPESLSCYHAQVEHARAEGLPQPTRPSKR